MQWIPVLDSTIQSDQYDLTILGFVNIRIEHLVTFIPGRLVITAERVRCDVVNNDASVFQRSFVGA